jgi:hypothetical protein
VTTPSGVRWWAPDRAVWWVAVLFMVGSACFAVGAVPAYLDLVGVEADGVTFFVGSLFFTAAAGLQLWLSTDRAQRWAGGVQFVGTLLFNISTFDALQSSLSADQADHRVWTPDVLGSIAFLVASALAYAEVRRPWLHWRPRDLGWSITTLNMVGSIAFGVSAAASYVLSDDSIRDAQRANAGTFLGAICFLVGAALLIPADEQVARPSTAEG